MSESSRKRSRTTINHATSTSAGVGTSSSSVSGNSSHTNASLDMITKKSSSASSPHNHNQLSSMLSIASPSHSHSHSHNHTVQQLTIEISHLKTELSKQKSLFSIDQMKSNNTIQRLQRFISSLQEDIKSANELVDVIKKESEDAIEDMNECRKKAVHESKIWQERFLQLKQSNDSSNNNSNDGDVQLLEKENSLLQKQIQSQNDEIHSLRAQLSLSVSSTLQQHNHESSSSTTPMKNTIQDNHDASIMTSPKSPAPPAVLSELNRTRVKLSETERHNRQLQHTISDLQTKANQYVTYREKVQHDKVKIEKLEKEIKSVRREREMHKLVEKRWIEFRQELIKLHLSKGTDHDATMSPSTSLSSSHDDENTPPEISTIIRHFHNLTNQIQQLQTDKSTTETKLQSSKRHIQSLEQNTTQLQTQMNTVQKENDTLQHLNVKLNKDYQMIQNQEKIWKRENDSMRSLIDSYELMEQNLSKISSGGSGEKDTSSSNSSSSKNIDAMQLSLKSATEEIELFKNRYDTMKTENARLEQENESSNEELTRVKKKFEQLRDALYKEREKTDDAEKRALEAETLAGKGSFNIETARVLHLSTNPTSIAMQEKYQHEIKALKDELQSYKAEEMSSSSGKGSTSKTKGVSTLDAQKLHKRLKESFRAQIAHFREGVYLLTGYKIDMVSEFDRPKFKVRSMYAENESDVLEFIWPELEEGKSPISLDMLNTKMGEALSREPCFKYIEKYESLPAFMASVCLSLFEKQTMIG